MVFIYIVEEKTYDWVIVLGGTKYAHSKMRRRKEEKAKRANKS
jgi:hypothetical protein